MEIVSNGCGVAVHVTTTHMKKLAGCMQLYIYLRSISMKVKPQWLVIMPCSQDVSQNVNLCRHGARSTVLVVYIYSENHRFQLLRPESLMLNIYFKWSITMKQLNYFHAKTPIPVDQLEFPSRPRIELGKFQILQWTPTHSTQSDNLFEHQ